MSIPTKIIAGDYHEFTDGYASYPANDGWAATLYLVGKNPATVAGVADGSAFKFALPSTTTKLWPPDLYQVFIRVSKAGVEVTVDQSTLEVVYNPATAPAGTDIRSHARITFDAIKATMEGRATKEHSSMMVGPPGGMQREVALLKPEELVYWYGVYSQMVSQEETEERINKGNSGPRYFTRFDSVP